MESLAELDDGVLALLEVVPVDFVGQGVADHGEFVFGEVVAAEEDFFQGVGDLEVEADLAGAHRPQEVGFQVADLEVGVEGEVLEELSTGLVVDGVELKAQELEGGVELEGLGNVPGAVVADAVAAEVEVDQDLVLDEELGELASPLVAQVVVGEVELDEGVVEHEAGRDELEEVVVDEVAGQVEGELDRGRGTRLGESRRISETSLASVNFMPEIFFLYSVFLPSAHLTRRLMTLLR